jgi:hypothetical protein
MCFAKWVWEGLKQMQIYVMCLEIVRQAPDRGGMRPTHDFVCYGLGIVQQVLM